MATIRSFKKNLSLSRKSCKVYELCFFILHIAYRYHQGIFGDILIPISSTLQLLGSLTRVRTGPGNPGKSLNLKNQNPGLENPGILLKVLESLGILNSEKLKSLQK